MITRKEDIRYFEINPMMWYRYNSCKFAMIKNSKDREVGLVVPGWCSDMMQRRTTRSMRCHNVQSFDWVFQKLGVIKQSTIYNYYYTLGAYEGGVPYITLDIGNRKEQVELWKENHWKSMNAFDFLIDIDAPNHKKMDFAYLSVIKIKDFFDKHNCPYRLRFTGCGFHFIIPSHYFGNNLNFEPFSKGNIFEKYDELLYYFFDNFGDLIDAGLHDSRRLVKMPGSISIYRKEIYTCIEFEDAIELEGFELEYMKPKYWLPHISSRKPHVFNENGNINKLLSLVDFNG